MPIFKNIFGCQSKDHVEKYKNDIIALSSRMDLMELSINVRMVRMEDRYEDIIRMLQEMGLDIRFIKSKL